MTYCSHRDIKSTRKEHCCDGCGQMIPIGSPAYYWAGDCEGEFYSCYYHSECRAAEIAWNDLQDLWGDEYTALCVIREEAEDCAWLVKNYPIVANRMGIQP